MFKSIYRTLLLLGIAFLIQAKIYSQNKFDEYAQAKVYLTQGDFLNATTLIKKLLTIDSNNIDLDTFSLIFTNYSTTYAILDLAWGCFAVATASWITSKIISI